MQVFCFCYSHNNATGGQKNMYHLVDALNHIGVAAFAYHRESGFRLTWFENQTTVVDDQAFDGLYDERCDIVILPEDLGQDLRSFPGRKVIYNQNIFYGFASFGDSVPELYPYLDPNVIGVLTLSRHNTEHLRFAYPHLCVRQIIPRIDAEMFPFVELRRKKGQIACVAKTRRQLRSLQHILFSRAAAGLNAISEFEWTILENMSEVEVSARLQESLLLVFLSTTEGLGLTALEAMACGCLVAGSKCGPLKEILPDQYQFELGDLLSMASFVEGIAAGYPDRLQHLDATVDSGRRRAADFTSERFITSVRDAWLGIEATLQHTDAAEVENPTERLTLGSNGIWGKAK
jgi:hypothetical protein